MTAATPGRRVSPAAASGRPSRLRPIFLDIARSEWVKLYPVRSTYWTLLVMAVSMVGFGALLTAAYLRHHASSGPAAPAAFGPAAYSLSGFFPAQLAIGVLGVVLITSEYATGSIRSTFAAAPQRGTVLAAKAVVFSAVALITGIVSSFAAFFTGQAILSRNGIETHISDPAAIRSVLGASLYLDVLGLLALGLGALIRHTAAAIAAVVGLVLTLPVLVEGLPASWRAATARYLPSAAGQAIIGRTKFTPPGQLLSPWTGFALFCAYAAAVLPASVICLSRRDA
jgi:ABC-2 type transport system permease protein